MNLQAQREKLEKLEAGIAEVNARIAEINAVLEQHKAVLDQHDVQIAHLAEAFGRDRLDDLLDPVREEVVQEALAICHLPPSEAYAMESFLLGRSSPQQSQWGYEQKTLRDVCFLAHSLIALLNVTVVLFLFFFLTLYQMINKMQIHPAGLPVVTNAVENLLLFEHLALARDLYQQDLAGLLRCVRQDFDLTDQQDSFLCTLYPPPLSLAAAAAASPASL